MRDSPAIAPITALVHPRTELKAPLPEATLDAAVRDAVIVPVPGEVVLLVTLSLAVAKILRDLISSRYTLGSAPN